MISFISKLGRIQWWAAISCNLTPWLQFKAIIVSSIIMPCEARWSQGQSHNIILNSQFHYYQYKLFTIMFWQCVGLRLSYYQYCNFQLCVSIVWVLGYTPMPSHTHDHRLVLCRLRLRALSRPSRAVGSRGRHKPSLRPVTAHGSGRRLSVTMWHIYIYQLINLISVK